MKDVSLRLETFQPSNPVISSRDSQYSNIALVVLILEASHPEKSKDFKLAHFSNIKDTSLTLEVSIFDISTSCNKTHISNIPDIVVTCSVLNPLRPSTLNKVAH